MVSSPLTLFIFTTVFFFTIVMKFLSFNLFVLALELENRLLARFDAASQKKDLVTMAECAKILSQVLL